jgi:hypothetical protein
LLDECVHTRLCGDRQEEVAYHTLSPARGGK